MEQNLPDFDHRQQETQKTIAQVSADLEQLTRQLNELKPVSKADVGASQSDFAVKVTEKLSVSDKKVDERTETVKTQQKTITDTAELLRDLMVGIENFGENVKDLRKEVEDWRQPEFQEAKEELQHLMCCEVIH